MRAVLLIGLIGIASAACPYMTGELNARDNDHTTGATEEFMSRYYLDDSGAFLTTDVGGQIEDQNSLSVGERGPTLLEDFIFRQKIQRFDHERVFPFQRIILLRLGLSWSLEVPERAVHARGTGAHGVFTSYGDFSNITAVSFLSVKDKETLVFVRFSTVAGRRGSSDLARDVHGFAIRFYTDEGNFDIVGNNIPVFFIHDAILFPDLIHAVKPRGDNEIPQAATAHDYRVGLFQPSTQHDAHALLGHGRPWHSAVIPSHRRASMVWEAQQVSGKNADYMREDLYDSIEAGRFPEWELGVQIMEEEDQLRFGFDLFDPTTIVPEELVPVTPLGKMTLNRNPRNYIAETEQVMFQPGHAVREIDFTEDPLLQGRLFSYLDTQLNRHNGPNFEQLPINQPRVPIHNNNRDEAGQMYIQLNPYAYTPNTLNNDSPKQANQTVGKGFFTAPHRNPSGAPIRAVSPTFQDVWSQPRLFYNSLVPAEKQFLIDAMRFENANVKSEIVRSNVIMQLNRVDNDLARRVALAVGIAEPGPDPTFYHNNQSINLGAFGHKLQRLDGLKVAVLASIDVPDSLSVGSGLTSQRAAENVDIITVAERFVKGVNQTYSTSDAIQFDAVVVAPGVERLFAPNSFTSLLAMSAATLFPAGRPLQILVDSFRFGKPVDALGSGSSALRNLDISPSRDGVYMAESVTSNFVDGIRDGAENVQVPGPVCAGSLSPSETS
ncbi:catalase-like domain-containing protein [Aspergillus pseudonomiae]|uniref:Catalase n=1 Tax=Aspergillus pseudonomiae TaxID=1506151 RepID=A0A5N7CU44_9EURO|nr:catalase-like domain-containing protein [Aspergillus pseudonomiae]KAE8397700.1 catalase-like domain-containing protein [Aspergillus pseudonomiae]